MGKLEDVRSQANVVLVLVKVSRTIDVFARCVAFQRQPFCLQELLQLLVGGRSRVWPNLG